MYLHVFYQGDAILPHEFIDDCLNVEHEEKRLPLNHARNVGAWEQPGQCIEGYRDVDEHLPHHQLRPAYSILSVEGMLYPRSPIHPNFSMGRPIEDSKDSAGIPGPKHEGEVWDCQDAAEKNPRTALL